MNPIVQIDLGKLENEIADFQEQIAKLQAALDLRLKVKEYAIQEAIEVNVEPVGHQEKSVNASGSEKHEQTNGHDFKLVPPSTQTFNGPSEFIIKLLKDKGELDTKTIIQSWADYKGVKYVDVRNSVFASLTRLGNMDRIRRRAIPGENNSIYHLK